MTQDQCEAIADLLHFCQYADNRLSLREERSIEQAVQALGWDQNVLWDDFETRSLSRVRQALDGQNDEFLALTAERLGETRVKQQALELVQKLFSSDGVVEAEQQALQILRKALGV